MSTEIVEELVIAKRMAEQRTQQMLNIVGAVVMNGSTKTKDAYELRVSKTALNKLDGRSVAIRFLKTGGVVITVKEAGDD